MRLVIGGYAQGKLNYVRQKYATGQEQIWDGEIPVRAAEGIVVINHLHSWVKKRLAAGGCPETEIFAFTEACPDCVLISDEIGNGIVPADAFEREYRERTGRILVQLAKEAEEVERVVCGLGQKIK